MAAGRPEGEGEEVPRIRLRRAAVSALGTLAVAAALCWWAARGVSFDDVRAGISLARPQVVAATLVLFTLSYFTVDVLGFALSWRRHLVPDLSWSVVRTLVCGKQVFFPVLPVLTKIVGPLYFWRHRGLRPLRVVGASEMIGTADLIAVVVLTTGSLIVSDVEIGSGFTTVLALCWILVLGGLAWLRSPRWQHRLPRLRSAALFHAFLRASPSELATQLGLRAIHLAVTLVCIQLLLAELGAALSPSQLLAFGPLFVFSCSLPISLAGYGGPQGLAVALLASRWHLVPAGHALAFSLIWSTGLVAFQAGVGLAHLPGLVRLLGGRPAHG